MARNGPRSIPYFFGKNNLWVKDKIVSCNQKVIIQKGSKKYNSSELRDTYIKNLHIREQVFGPQNYEHADFLVSWRFGSKLFLRLDDGKVTLTLLLASAIL